MVTGEKFQCPARVNSSPQGRCVRVEGHPGEHVATTSAQGGFRCPNCNRVFAAIHELDAHVPCAVEEKTPLGLGDRVRVRATGRIGKINGGVPARISVQYSDGEKPPSEVFLDESELELIQPAPKDSGSKFVLDKGITGKKQPK